MRIDELKQRALVQNTKTGEVLQVSKRINGIYLVDPITKKAVNPLSYPNAPEDFEWLKPYRREQ